MAAYPTPPAAPAPGRSRRSRPVAALIRSANRVSASSRAATSCGLAPFCGPKTAAAPDDPASGLFTSLASVILQMVAVGVMSAPDEVVTFPFVDPPDTRAVRDGVALLHELGALARSSDTGAWHLTDVGRRLAALPVDGLPGLPARAVTALERFGLADRFRLSAAALLALLLLADLALPPPLPEH